MTGRSIENRQFIMQSLTYDYRIINGAEADDFQCRLKAILEDPQTLVG
jgi:pyruvate/2-oxoglutarate dehydrogenase complex dihydrolipoamide acyltransferase (E2) component